MYKSRGFSILNITIAVGLIVTSLAGIAFYAWRLERQQTQEAIELIEEWRQKPAEERGIIIRDSLIEQTEKISKNITDLDSQLARVELMPTLTEAAIKDFRLKFFLLGKEITEAEIKTCCAKELEQYLRVYHITRSDVQRNMPQ